MQQYKHERECNAIIAQTREDKILRLESLMDGVLPTEEFMEEELVVLTHEHKVEICSFILQFQIYEHILDTYTKLLSTDFKG